MTRFQSHADLAAGQARTVPNRRFRRSAIAIGIATLLASPVHAQQATGEEPASQQATELDSVTVKGVRGAVIRAQEIKQEATQIVDSVTAEDIGALPDRSVTETLKRVSGVTVTQFLARDDPDHFSAEGSGVMIRGLTQVRGELNGRDVFSANGGRGLSFEEVPSELMAGVDVYKNPAADIIEGGLGGTVNLRTRMPFDDAERRVAASIDYNHGDFAKQGNPSGSFLFSDRWQTGIGEIGFLANLSYLGTGHPLGRHQSRRSSAATTRRCWKAPTSTAYIPGGVNWRTLDFERKREGAAFAFQWRPNENTEVYPVPALEVQHAWREHSMTFGDQLQEPTARGATTTSCRRPTRFTYDASWRVPVRLCHAPAPGNRLGQHRLGQHRLEPAPGSQHHRTVLRPGALQPRLPHHQPPVQQETVTTDWSAGFRHFMTDNLVMRGDFQYVKSNSKPVDFSVIANTFLSNVFLDLTGKYPSLQLAAEREQLQDPASYSWLAAMDNLPGQPRRGTRRRARLGIHLQRQQLVALRPLRCARRHARTGQQDSGWDNWMPISATGRPRPGATGSTARGTAATVGVAEPVPDPVLRAVFDGQLLPRPVNVPGNLWYRTMPSWNWPTRAPPSRPCMPTPGGGRTGLAAGRSIPRTPTTCVNARRPVYGVLYFENDDLLGGRRLDGNVGVRVVKTSTRANGFGQIPNLSGQTRLTPELRERFDGSYFDINSATSYTDVLPSLNLRLHLTDKLQWRVAASKAIARPEFRQMTAWLPLRVGISDTCQPDDDPEVPFVPCGFEYLQGFSGSAGNPELEPMRANQFDTALEWYFGPANMVYATVFHKDVKGYFVSGCATK